MVNPKVKRLFLKFPEHQAERGSLHFLRLHIGYRRLSYLNQLLTIQFHLVSSNWP
uniref:Uncharacterized protein n=1 Tax=Rhizophora mucronata TaxID=61149 RepID=A0A2P2QDM7_RHIMU